MRDGAAHDAAGAKSSAQPSLSDALRDALSSDLTIDAHAERLLRLAHALTGATGGAVLTSAGAAPKTVGAPDEALVDLARATFDNKQGESRARDRVAKRIDAGSGAFVVALRISGGSAALAVGWERLILLSELSLRRDVGASAQLDDELLRNAAAVARGDWSAAQAFVDRVRTAAKAEAVVLGDFEDRLLVRHVVSDAPALARVGSADDQLRARLSTIARGEPDEEGGRLGAAPDGFGLILIGSDRRDQTIAAFAELFALPQARRRRISGLRRFRAPLIAAIALGLLAAVPLPDNVQAPATVAAEVYRIATAPMSARLVEMRVVEGDVVAAGETIAQLDTRDIDANISQERAKLGATLTRLQDARARRDEGARRDAELEMAQIQARIDLNETLREAATIVAPISGVVVKDHGEAKVGATLAVGVSIIEIAGARNEIVEAWIAERERARVVVGDRALVRLDASPDRDIEAEVVKIAPIAEQRAGFNVFRIELSVASDEDWSVGMQGVAAFDHRRRAAALVAGDSLRDWLKRNFIL